MGNKIKELRVLKVSSKRQLAIPKAYLDHLGVEAPAEMELVLTDIGMILRPIKRSDKHE